jgi:hypothetical protein
MVLDAEIMSIFLKGLKDRRRIWRIQMQSMGCGRYKYDQRF